MADGTVLNKSFRVSDLRVIYWFHIVFSGSIPVFMLIVIVYKDYIASLFRVEFLFDVLGVYRDLYAIHYRILAQSQAFLF